MLEHSIAARAGFVHLQEIYRSLSTVVARGVRSRDRTPVVLKYSASESPSLRDEAARRNELDILSELESPHIIRAYGIEQLEDRLLLVEEDFDGVTLAAYFRDHVVAIDTFLAIAITIADAVAAVHARGIIHKDISPHNILIDPRSRAVKLIDFGIASRLARESHDLRTPDGIQGTLAYISPEQTYRMNRAVDARTDLYSLGATFYHLLANAPPFGELSTLELVHAHIAREPRRLCDAAPRVPPIIGRIIERLMSKPLETRYQSALGLRHDLELCARCSGTALQDLSFELGQHDVATRFELPAQLYGRAHEINMLLSGFERVAAGQCELLRVGGSSGIGKSSLVHEVQKPIVRARGYFISGKFDQFNRAVPYSALGQAFGQMIEAIFSEPPERIAQWRARIVELVGPNGRLLADVVPGLEQLIGAQPVPAALASSEAQTRFTLLFQRFARMFAHRDHPLVLFLDDLQWADNPSLQLLESLLGDARVAYLYVITSYRHDEVGLDHPFALAAERIRATGTTVHDIALGPLSPADATELVAATLRHSHAEVAPLAELLHDKTGGNPFFLRQLLCAFHDTGLVRIDPASNTWQWDLAQILEVGVTDNVIDVMTLRLRRLPDRCTRVLTVAACIGGAFDLRSLATVCEAPYHVVAEQLWPALDEGLVACSAADYQATYDHVPSDAGEQRIAIRDELHRKLRDEIDAGRFNVTYRFVHDRVQQAAYQLIPPLERQVRHLHIGRLLLRDAGGGPHDPRDELIFELTNHLNLGIALVEDPTERLTIAWLNLRAGLRAKSAAANRTAIRHFTIALDVVGSTPASWDAHYALLFPLHKHLAECHYLVGEPKASEQRSMEAIARGRTTHDVAELYATRVQLLMTGSELAKASQVACDGLALLGFDVPADRAAQAAQYTQLRAHIEQRLAGIEPASLAELPAIRDPDRALGLELLAHAYVASTIAREAMLARLQITWMVATSLEHGHTAASAYGYVVYGAMLATEGDYRRGFEFGELARRISEEVYPDPVHATRVRIMFANSLSSYFNHLEANHGYYFASYVTGSQVGDLIYTVWAAQHMIMSRMMTGDPLADVLAESDRYLPVVRDGRNHNMLIAYETNRQVIRCLQGQTAGAGSLDGPGYNEAERIGRLRGNKFWTGVVWYGGMKLCALMLLGHYEQALAQAIANEAVSPSEIGQWTATNHYFYQTLAIFQALGPIGAPGTPVAPPAISAEQRAEYDRLVERNLAKVSAWAQTGAVNFFHRLQLMLAEQARVAGRYLAAVEHYDLAIDHASRGRFTHDEALALELAGRLYRWRGRTRVSRVYLTDAYYAYARWGAVAKTRLMMSEYGDQLLIAGNSRPSASNYHATREGNGWLDLATVMKAAQTISSEIVHDKLLATVMSILTQNAGAERGVLLLDQRGELAVEVVSRAGSASLVRCALADYSELATGVVALVYASKRSIVLDDARLDARFIDDPYVARVRPKSLLCLPIINQGRLRGVVYFEDNRSCGAFTGDRLALLELLISQVAIAIENATLYGDLESRVQERTEALRKSLDELTVAQQGLEAANAALHKEIRERQEIETELQIAHKLEAVGRLAAGIAHEINTPIQFVQDQVSFVQEASHDLLHIIEIYDGLQAVARDHGPPALVDQLTAFERDTDLQYLADRIPEALEQALYGLGRVTTLVRSMKEFARADQRDKAPADINRALSATLAIAHNEYKYVANVKTAFGELPPVVCHINELNQCFLNLIVNAAHAIADASAASGVRGTIELTTEVDRDTVVISIADTGGGIPVAIRDKIFEPFFTTKAIGRGTGQGLAIARNVVVDKHAGSLTFETELGRGTKFVIRLPIDGGVS